MIWLCVWLEEYYRPKTRAQIKEELEKKPASAGFFMRVPFPAPRRHHYPNNPNGGGRGVVYVGNICVK